MQPRCAMRFESHTPKSLAMRNRFFTNGTKTHSEITGKSKRNLLRKSCDVGLRCGKIGKFFREDRAMRNACNSGLPLRSGLQCERPRCRIASDVGRAMRTTKFGSFSQPLVRVPQSNPLPPSVFALIFAECTKSFSFPQFSLLLGKVKCCWTPESV